MKTGRVRTVALRKQRQEDHDKFKVSLVYVVRLHLKQTKTAQKERRKVSRKDNILRLGLRIQFWGKHFTFPHDLSYILGQTLCNQRTMSLPPLITRHSSTTSMKSLEKNI